MKSETLFLKNCSCLCELSPKEKKWAGLHGNKLSRVGNKSPFFREHQHNISSFTYVCCVHGEAASYHGLNIARNLVSWLAKSYMHFEFYLSNWVTVHFGTHSISRLKEALWFLVLLVYPIVKTLTPHPLHIQASWWYWSGSYDFCEIGHESISCYTIATY